MSHAPSPPLRERLAVAMYVSQSCSLRSQASVVAARISVTLGRRISMPDLAARLSRKWCLFFAETSLLLAWGGCGVLMRETTGDGAEGCHQPPALPARRRYPRQRPGRNWAARMSAAGRHGDDANHR
jgi:hypothetical protein